MSFGVHQNTHSQSSKYAELAEYVRGRETNAKKLRTTAVASSVTYIADGEYGKRSELMEVIKKKTC